MNLAIIGGGASSLMLASYLKKNNSKINITIFERNKGLGRKILASGNGKCNFMNYKATPFDYNNPSFVEELFKMTPKDEVINYFDSLGLLFKFDSEGRMYPQTDSSLTILELLTSELKDTKVLLEREVFNIKEENNKVIINDNLIFDYAILASGSSASILERKSLNIYNYFKDLNLNFIAPTPVLVGFKTNENFKLLQGLRCKCKIKYEGMRYYEEQGEVIFKSDGISGICIMNASRYFKDDSKLKIDLLPATSKEDILLKINKRKEESSDPNYYLTGICHNKLKEYLIKNNITKPEDVSKVLKEFIINVNGLYSLEEAQVARGGIELSELSKNLSLNKYPHIFACGEVLNIDGACGGYNLLFAFTSGLHIAKELLRYENKGF